MIFSRMAWRLLLRFLQRPMLLQEFPGVRAVTESPGAPGACHRKRSRQISIAQAGFDIGSANVLMDEPSIKTVSCADWIHSLDGDACGVPFVLPAPRHGTLAAELHHHQRNTLSQPFHGLSKIRSAGELSNFPFVQ